MVVENEREEIRDVDCCFQMMSVVLAGWPVLKGAMGLGLFLCLVPAAVILVTQRIMLGDLKTTLKWLAGHTAAAITELVLVDAVLLIFLGLTNRYWAAFTVTMFLAYVFASADHIKYETALTHFLWSDLFKTSDPGKFKEMVGHYIQAPVFIPIAVILAVGNLVLLGLDPAPFARGLAGWLPRMAVLLGGLLLMILFRFYALWVNLPFCRRVLRLPAFTSSDYDGNVNAHGSLLAFCGHITTVAIEQDPPQDYGREQAAAIAAVCKTVAAADDAAGAKATGPKAAGTASDRAAPVDLAKADGGQLPTIIVLAVESMWDITRVKGLSFQEDPLEPFRADYVGEARANCFAGLTSNTEFEFLTSLSMQFLHDSACPFIKIDRPVPAMPAQLRELGYKTTAIHSYTRTFYSRDSVYPLLGFDQFFGLEDLEKAGPVAKKGWYMGDEALVQPMVDLLEQENGPQLIYTLTVQNHGPYIPDRYQEAEFEPEATPNFAPDLILSSADRRAIINYTQGVRDAAKMYRAIRDYCQQLDRPVIILAFGDHLPGIGDNSGFRVFMQAGMIETTRDDALYSLPVFCWTNPAARANGLTTDIGGVDLRGEVSGMAGSVMNGSGEAKSEPFGLAKREPFGPMFGFNTLAPRLLRCANLPLNSIQLLALAAEARQRKTRSLTDDDLLRAYAWLQYDWLWGQQLIDPKDL